MTTKCTNRALDNRKPESGALDERILLGKRVEDGVSKEIRTNSFPRVAKDKGA